MAMNDCFYVTLDKLQFMHMETCHISNLGSQDVSKEILSDLVRKKDVAQLYDKFYHFKYAALEMFKEAINNYSKLKLDFFINTHIFAIYYTNVSHQYYATIQDSKPHILSRNAPK